MAHSEHYQLWHPEDHVWTEWEEGYPGPNNDPDDAYYIGYAHLIHFIRDTDEGCEMRSRFWAGDVEIAVPLIGSLLGLAANTKAIRSKLATVELGRHLLVHCAEEMNNMAKFLPAVFQKATQKNSIGS